MNSLIILGPPRSGTSWLASIFDSNPQTLLRFQPLFSHSHKGALTSSSGKEEVAQFLRDVFSSSDKFATMQAQYFESFPKFQKHEPDLLVIKETRFLDLARVFLSDQNTKVLGILRNPLETLNSWVTAPREFNQDWSVDVEWFEGKKKNSEQVGGFYGLKKWVEAAVEFERLSQASDRFEIVRYDHLTSDTFNEVERIFHWCGLSMSESTKTFLRESGARWSDDPYSVFRGGSKTEWQISEEVTAAARHYIEESGFSHYLPNRETGLC